MAIFFVELRTCQKVTGNSGSQNSVNLILQKFHYTGERVSIPASLSGCARRELCLYPGNKHYLIFIIYLFIIFILFDYFNIIIIIVMASEAVTQLKIGYFCLFKQFGLAYVILYFDPRVVAFAPWSTPPHSSKKLNLTVQ